jgi:hypothetical protein
MITLANKDLMGVCARAFFVKLMAIFAFLKEKKNEKRKNYWSFLQIRTMCMPLGHLENEFGCNQLKVSFWG